MNEQHLDSFWNEPVSAGNTVLQAVELEPGLVTRASKGTGTTILHNACQAKTVDLARDLVDRKAAPTMLRGKGRIDVCLTIWQHPCRRAEAPRPRHRVHAVL